MFAGPFSEIRCSHVETLQLGNQQGRNMEAQISSLSLTRQDVPDRSSGPVDELAGRTDSSSGHYGQHTKHRTLILYWIFGFTFCIQDGEELNHTHVNLVIMYVLVMRCLMFWR